METPIDSITSVPMMVYPYFQKPFILDTYALKGRVRCYVVSVLG